MSVSSLPEWKQLLLEKKRREEEARERREKEEEEKFASMPAWKRGIIERRKAKQEVLGDRDRERDACLMQADFRCPSDGLSDTDSSVTVNLGSELSLSPDPGLWLDAGSQVSLETIVPVHENPFIRTQSVWRKGRDSDVGFQEKANEVEVKEKDKDKPAPRGQEGESWRGRDIERKIERFRDLSEGREKERSRDRSQGRDRESNREALDKEKGRDVGRDAEFLKARKDEEDKETDAPGSYSPLVPGLRTIRAENIIIIEQERKGSDERRGRWREPERERPEEEHQGKRGMKMDLREILAGGGSVTEIRASEVLIIKPPASAEGGKCPEKEDGETKCAADGRRESLRELRTDISWLREKEMAKEKERPCGQATVIKEDRKDSWDDNVFVERGGRVSQLLSKFGEHPKPPSRSKSSDNFLRPGRRKYSGDHDDQQTEERKADLSKSVPKRSLSFSDRVVSGKENGLDEYYEMKAWERLHSESSMAPWVDVAGLGRGTPAKIKLGCAWLLDKGRCGKPKVDPFDRRAAEKEIDADGDEGFTVASVKNTEGISFARRVPIRQDGKPREAWRQERGQDKDPDAGRQTEARLSDKKLHDFHGEGESPTPAEVTHSFVTDAPVEPSCHYKHEADCSSLLCGEADRGAEWNGPGQQGPYLTHSVLSQQTEELISKIEKIGETSVYSSERGAYRASKDSKQESQAYGEASIHAAAPRSPKRIAPVGIPSGPLDIQIPRTVFYVAEEMVGSKKAAEQSSEAANQEGGQGVERRDSWRIGKPLSRIESLREKIRQKEQERLRQQEGKDGDGGEAGVDVGDALKPEDEEVEVVNEWEAAAHKRTSEADRVQEDAAEQTSATAFDVTQEVSLSKACPLLPVSVLHSEAVREEVAFGFTAAASEAARDSFQSSGDEDDDQQPLKHAEEQLRQHSSRRRDEDAESEEEEKELSEEEEEGYTSALDPSQSLSPSPPHPASLAAMSRIYNLETVGSRSALCLRERMDISSVHLVKVKPLISNVQQGDGKEDVCGVPAIQRQIEQFQLRGQEALQSQHATSGSPSAPLKDREAKGQQGRGAAKSKDDVKTPQETLSEANPRPAPQRVCSPKPPVQTSNAAFLRNQSPDKSRRPSDSAPTPASSPCSQSPSISPSPTPSPPLFSIKSASGGAVKRGATITITPKKPAGGGGRATASAPSKTPQQQQAQAEPAKKKYPGVEEIQVIGGYQSLEKSCLVKSKGSSKRGKVCFDEEQLEQVCEYPSETSMLASMPYPHDPRPPGDGTQAEEDEPGRGPTVSKSSRNVGTATGRGLRVGQCHPLLKKHSV